PALGRDFLGHITQDQDYLVADIQAVVRIVAGAGTARDCQAVPSKNDFTIERGVGGERKWAEIFLSLKHGGRSAGSAHAELILIRQSFHACGELERLAIIAASPERFEARALELLDQKGGGFFRSGLTS